MCLTLGSVCSGVGGMDMGLEAAGFKALWLCEKDAQCRTVLNHRFPGVPVYSDLETLADEQPPAVQLLAGGTPCQDLSVAGRRAGLDGERSGLFFDFIRLADTIAPDWVLWENVDGALSSSEGEDFAVCLEGFTGFQPEVPEEGWRSSGVCVGPYRWCVWRVLDAQWFGVAQRRARLFVVAGTGEQPRPEILLEPESVSGDSAPSRATGEGTAAEPEGGADGNGQWWNGSDVTEALSTTGHRQQMPDKDRCGVVLAGAVTSKWAKGSGGPAGNETQNLVVHAVDLQQVTSKANRVRPSPECPPLNTAGNVAVMTAIPRRLTPRECERLMGWPDDWTLVNGMKDSPRYRMIGNGVVAPVARWIGERVMRAASLAEVSGT